MSVKVNIKETNLDFGALSERRYTDMIVILVILMNLSGGGITINFAAGMMNNNHICVATFRQRAKVKVSFLDVYFHWH